MAEKGVGTSQPGGGRGLWVEEAGLRRWAGLSSVLTVPC